VDRGKNKRIRELFDIEKERGKVMLLMVKVGGGGQEKGLGEAEAALGEIEVEFCKRIICLIVKKELEKRREFGSLTSTVVVRVRGKVVVHQLD